MIRRPGIFQTARFDIASLTARFESRHSNDGCLRRREDGRLIFPQVLANQKCFVGRLTDKDYRCKGNVSLETDNV
jgi:hypothetical protein